MSISPQPSPPPISLPPAIGCAPPAVFRLSVDQYHQMIEVGVLNASDNVELLEGLLVPKMGKKRLHSFVTGMLVELLRQLCGARFFVDSQEPVSLADSEPEPDVVVVRGSRQDYQASHPRADQIPLLVEVADTSLAQDEGLKMRIYARTNVTLYWLVNLVNRDVTVFSQPSGPSIAPGYGQQRVFRIGEMLPLQLDGEKPGEIAVRDLFPAQPSP